MHTHMHYTYAFLTSPQLSFLHFCTEYRSLNSVPALSPGYIAYTYWDFCYPGLSISLSMDTMQETASCQGIKPPHTHTQTHSPTHIHKHTPRTDKTHSSQIIVVLSKPCCQGSVLHQVWYSDSKLVLSTTVETHRDFSLNALNCGFLFFPVFVCKLFLYDSLGF